MWEGYLWICGVVLSLEDMCVLEGLKEVLCCNVMWMIGVYMSVGY